MTKSTLTSLAQAVLEEAASGEPINPETAVALAKAALEQPVKVSLVEAKELIFEMEKLRQAVSALRSAGFMGIR